MRQIELYDPEVIIVCGTDTLQALNKDFGLDLSNPARTITRGKAVVDVHHWRGKRIVWAPHPAAHIRPEDWVDAVIAALR
jgi:uracil-DNA glycosylase